MKAAYNNIFPSGSIFRCAISSSSDITASLIYKHFLKCSKQRILAPPRRTLLLRQMQRAAKARAAAGRADAAD